MPSRPPAADPPTGFRLRFSYEFLLVFHVSVPTLVEVVPYADNFNASMRTLELVSAFLSMP